LQERTSEPGTDTSDQRIGQEAESAPMHVRVAAEKCVRVAEAPHAGELAIQGSHQIAADLAGAVATLRTAMFTHLYQTLSEATA
jgi:hypothetical protein